MKAGNRLVDAVSHEIGKAEAQKRERDRMVKLNQNGHLFELLKQAEAKGGAACAVMGSIREAENLCGRRLCLRINAALLLTSQGFRLVSKFAPVVPQLFFKTGNVQKISSQRIKKYLDPRYRQQDVLRDVTSLLVCSDLTHRLLYMGVDEWPLYGRVLFCLTAAATGTMSSILYAGPHYLRRRNDYELALRPVLKG